MHDQDTAASEHQQQGRLYASSTVYFGLTMIGIR